MTDNDIAQHQRCQHYPNRVLHKPDLAVELGVCEKTVYNLLKAGELPEPTWLNSIQVWMLYDIHAYISANAGKPRRDIEPSGPDAKATGGKRSRSTGQKAGKYRV